nr:SymE family type I addiction module toxin [Yersinia pseudotuberculosis]
MFLSRRIYKTKKCGWLNQSLCITKNIIKTGFTPGTKFKIQPYRNGLIITLIASEIATQQVLNEIENDHHIGMDWIQDNSEMYLAGDWLTQTGLTG